MPKNRDFSTTISKDEINALPIMRFEGKVSVISSESKSRQAIEILSDCDVLGFDTETKPSFTKGTCYDVALLQLATKERVFLFRLNHMGLTSDLITLLSNAKIKKVGVAVQDDVKGLNQLTKFKSQGFVDLSSLAQQLEIKHVGLRSLAAIFLGGRVTKRTKLTNWENSRLTPAQVNYAATDAWISRELHSVLSELVNTSS